MAAATVALGDNDVGDLGAKGLNHLVGVSVDLDLVAVKSRALWDVVHAAFALFLLKLEGDATNVVTAAEALHKLSHVTGDLVAHALGGSDGDVINHL